MKRYHKTTLAGEELTLSLSYKTSLEIMDEVQSPSTIIETILYNYAASLDGKELSSEFRFNERNAVKILALANKPHEALGEDYIGNLAIQEGFTGTYAKVLRYLQEMVMGRSKEMPAVENKEPSAEK